MEKESKEISRVRNRASGKELGGFSTLRPACRAGRHPDPAGAGADTELETRCIHRHPGVLYRCERKGVAGEGICKCVERKDLQIDEAGRGICKWMKTKDRRK